MAKMRGNKIEQYGKNSMSTFSRELLKISIEDVLNHFTDYKRRCLFHCFLRLKWQCLVVQACLDKIHGALLLVDARNFFADVRRAYNRCSYSQIFRIWVCHYQNNECNQQQKATLYRAIFNWKYSPNLRKVSSLRFGRNVDFSTCQSSGCTSLSYRNRISKVSLVYLKFDFKLIRIF